MNSSWAGTPSPQMVKPSLLRLQQVIEFISSPEFQNEKGHEVRMDKLGTKYATRRAFELDQRLFTKDRLEKAEKISMEKSVEESFEINTEEEEHFEKTMNGTQDFELSGKGCVVKSLDESLASFSIPPSKSDGHFEESLNESGKLEKGSRRRESPVKDTGIKTGGKEKKSRRQPRFHPYFPPAETRILPVSSKIKSTGGQFPSNLNGKIKSPERLRLGHES